MSAVVAVDLAGTSALARWLRFDPERVPEVEAAYDTFLRRTRWGVYFLAALFFSFVGLAIALVVEEGASKAQQLSVAAVTWAILFYGIQAFALFRVPRETLRAMLVGAVDWRRACIVAVAMGVLATSIETGMVLALNAAHVKLPTKTDPFVGGVVFGVFLMLAVAPIVEEFLMQGWLQSKLLRFGTRRAALFATIAFVLLHVPTTLYALVRFVGLACAATLRGTTRSLLAAIVVHFTSNACVLALIVTGKLMLHK